MHRISTRLTVAFLLVALLPAVPLSLVVRNLLERSFAPSLDVGVEEALQAGLDESRDLLRRRRESLAELVDRVATVPGAGAALVPAGALPPRLVLLDVDDGPLGRDARAAALMGWPALSDLGGDDAPPGRVGPWLTASAVDPRGDRWGLAVRLPEGAVERAGKLTDGIALVRTVRRERGKVLHSFVGPFLVVYGLLLLSALAVGGLQARRLVRPLEALVAGTHRVAAGDLRTPVTVRGPGEVGDLVQAFNAMLGRLDAQRRDLARLERAAAWRGMARTLAHEVKNPLTPILLAVQEARDGYRGDDTAYRALLEECHDIVREEVETLRRLVREFGDFARLPRPQPRAGDLVAVVADVQRLHGERMVYDGPATAPAWIDEEALRRVLVNLVDNGLTACREAGRALRVRVKLELTENRARLAVSDEGAGIPPEHLERVFEPDFTTKGDRGMGLGLAICAGVVAGHGGTITVASTVGQGTTFTLEIPRRPPPGANPEAS